MSTADDMPRDIGIQVTAHHDGAGWHYELKNFGDAGPHEVAGLADFALLWARQAMINVQRDGTVTEPSR